MIAHLLSTIPYYEVQRPPLDLPPREMQTHVPDYAESLRGE